jgi:prepilin peptidase CpaA
LLVSAPFAIGIAALTVTMVAGVQDIRERLIANRLVALLLGLGVLRHMVSATSLADGLASAGAAFLLAALVFAVGFVIWRIGSLGGGDVKLLVAAVFFVGPGSTLALLITTALAGGALALAYLLVPRLLPSHAVRLADPAALGAGDHSKSLPYGVAIAAGFGCTVIPSLPALLG